MKVGLKYWLSSLAVVMAVMTLFTSTPVVFADHINPGVLAINGQVGGLTYGQWSALWWKYAFSVKTFANCPKEPSGPMWFLAGTFNGSIARRECTVPPRKNIMFPIFNAEWSVAEAEAQEHATTIGTSCPIRDIHGRLIFGEDYSALMACATAFAQHGTDSKTTFKATVDGVPLQRLVHYRALSPAPPFLFTEVAGNPVGLCPSISPCPLTSHAVADGFWIILNPPLTAGKHEIDFKAHVPVFKLTTGANYCLIVQPSNQTCP